jgi:hypothetical protein
MMASMKKLFVFAVSPALPVAAMTEKAGHYR